MMASRALESFVKSSHPTQQRLVGNHPTSNTIWKSTLTYELQGFYDNADYPLPMLNCSHPAGCCSSRSQAYGPGFLG